MLWNEKNKYELFPFIKEEELEKAIIESQKIFFGERRYYIDIKKKIGAKGKTNNIPDGYLLDLTSNLEPRIFVVENELATHHSLKHIAVQILEFSLSFETSKRKIKNIIKDSLNEDPEVCKKIEAFASKNNYGNIDFLLESILYKEDSFNVLLIIDEADEELETLLYERFRFPVEVKTFKRYKNEDEDILYEFVPFYQDVIFNSGNEDISDLNTIIVPAREDGFKEVFIGEDCWYSIRINKTMIPKIKYIAVYQVAPISAITHIAEVESIEQYKHTNKYIITFKEPAKKIKIVKLGKNKRKAPQSPRYCSYDNLLQVDSLDDLL